MTLATTPPTVAISTSESPDMFALGLSDDHLREAAAEIALNMLSSGRSLAYGGDLRDGGFTELLFELVERYRGHPRHAGDVSVVNYTPWPVHIRMKPAMLQEFTAGHERSAQLILLAPDGSRLTPERRCQLARYEPDDGEWNSGLTAMRRVMRAETDARIVLGGRVTGYKGVMPGIAEEALLSIRAGQPVYLIGGFGGCARDIAETIGLVESWAGSRDAWEGRSKFEGCSSADLRNGLSADENAILAQTPHISQAVALVSRGLRQALRTSSKTSPD